MVSDSPDRLRKLLPAKPFLTTGEAGKILGLSASTIIRRFDKDEFTGTRHPVTGRRLVARESLAGFMAAHNLSMDELSTPSRRILVASKNPADGDMLQTILRGIADIEVLHLLEGCEVCGRALAWRPDLAIIDTQLPDMAGLDVVRCLRKLPGFEKVPVAVSSAPDGRPSEKEQKTLGIGECFCRPWEGEVLTEGTSRLLGIAVPEKQKPQRFHEKRKWPRIATDWPAAVEVYLKDGTREYDSGTAKVRNASQGGVLLSGLQLKQGALPATAFTLGLNMTAGQGQGITVTCRPVRIEAETELAFGVQFMRLRSNQLARIAEALTR